MVAVEEQVTFRGRSAIVRFIGTTKFAPGTWVGLELDSPVGKNDGSVQGVQYFKCKHPGNFGVFVRQSLLESNQSVSLDVASIVNRLQGKLRNVQLENSSLRDSIEQLRRELEQSKDDVTTMELALESATVESDFIESQNSTLNDKINSLSVMYDNLRADYDILKEELDIYKELEDAVRLQIPSDHSLLVEDFSVLVQHNKRLELAYSSLESLMATKEEKLVSELNLLKFSHAEALKRIESSDITKDQLHEAQASIRFLHEQLEISLELVLMVERLTTENEVLLNKISKLQSQVQEFTELQELDRALETEHIQKERELQKTIELLIGTLEREKSKVASLLSAHKESTAMSKSPEDKKSFELQENDELMLMKNELKSFKSTHKITLQKYSLLQIDWGVSQELIFKLTTSEQRPYFFHLLSLKSFLEKISVSSHTDANHELKNQYLIAVVSFAILVIETNWGEIEIESFSLLLKNITDSLTDLTDETQSMKILESTNKFEKLLVEFSPEWLIRVHEVKKLHSTVMVLIKAFASIENSGVEIEPLIISCLRIKETLEAALHKDELAYFDCDLDIDILNSIKLEYKNDNAELNTLAFCLKSVLDRLETALVILPGPVQSIYSSYINNTSKEDKRLVASLQGELDTKQRQLQEILLHVELLEKNMALAISKKDSELELETESLKSMMLKAQQLQNQLNEVHRKNLELEQQLRAFLEFDEETKYHFIPIFEEKMVNSDSTLHATLLEEIRLLKKMLEPKIDRNKWHKHLDCLREPLVSTKKKLNGMHFLKQAHSTRKLAAKILLSVPKAKSNSQRLHYLLI